MAINLDELAGNLSGIFDAIQEQYAAEITLRGAVQLNLSLHKRIFTDGKDTDGAPIAAGYSTDPIYATKEQIGGRFKAIGKSTEVEKVFTVSKSGIQKQKVIKKKRGDTKKDRKTMYLSDGYKELRQLRGRRVDQVNLFLSGSLSASIKEYQQDLKAVVAIASSNEIEKVTGHEEERYKKDIFKPSKEDVKESNRAMSEEVARVFEKLISQKNRK